MTVEACDIKPPGNIGQITQSNPCNKYAVIILMLFNGWVKACGAQAIDNCLGIIPADESTDLNSIGWQALGCRNHRAWNHRGMDFQYRGFHG